MQWFNTRTGRWVTYGTGGALTLALSVGTSAWITQATEEPATNSAQQHTGGQDVEPTAGGSSTGRKAKAERADDDVQSEIQKAQREYERHVKAAAKKAALYHKRVQQALEEQSRQLAAPVNYTPSAPPPAYVPPAPPAPVQLPQVPSAAAFELPDVQVPKAPAQKRQAAPKHDRNLVELPRVIDTPKTAELPGLDGVQGQLESMRQGLEDAVDNAREDATRMQKRLAAGAEQLRQGLEDATRTFTGTDTDTDTAAPAEDATKQTRAAAREATTQAKAAAREATANAKATAREATANAKATAREATAEAKATAREATAAAKQATRKVEQQETRAVQKAQPQQVEVPRPSGNSNLSRAMASGMDAAGSAIDAVNQGVNAVVAGTDAATSAQSGNPGRAFNSGVQAVRSGADAASSAADAVKSGADAVKSLTNVVAPAVQSYYAAGR